MIERIRQFIEYKKISVREFSRKIGISHSLLANAKTIGADKLESILTEFPEINPIWLLTGKGEMLKENYPISNKNIQNTDGFVGNNIKGNISITHNDLEKILELYKSSQDIQNELNERLKTSQEQVSALLEILKKK